MSNTLAQAAKLADGRYLDDHELHSFETLVDTFTTRLALYNQLKNNGKTLVINALRRVNQIQQRKVIQEHGAKCQRDMLYTLDCVAKAVLIGDIASFLEDYVVWMQNITRALHKEDSAVAAYRALQLEVRGNLSREQALTVNNYLDQLIKAITNGM